MPDDGQRTDVRGEIGERLESFVSPLGFTSPELRIVEDFHDETKFKPYQLRSLGRRIGAYLTARRAVEETVANRKTYSESEMVRLPPSSPLGMPLGEVFAQRKSCRRLSGARLGLAEFSGIMSALRVNRRAKSGLFPDLQLSFRPYPSGGGLYPCETYAAVLSVDGIDRGLYHYCPFEHGVSRIGGLPTMTHFMRIMSDEDALLANAAAVVFTSIIAERSVVKYGARGYRFALFEAGIIPMMVNLAAVASGCAALNWGGFIDDSIDGMFGLDGVSETMVSCIILGKEMPP